ncbi:MAG TPA: serine/threonine protein kinase, partial [Candidatus Nanoarchaeia archaeon]|nr:serine/threonine protein kinase [Candidatus Nanoarchaeia archaeon]
MELYAKGKRGIIYLDGNTCIKVKNPEAEIDTLKNEADYLKILNKEGIGPKLIKFQEGKLYREFVEGKRISDFLEQEADNQKIISVIRQVLEQCRKLDLLGIGKKELTNPYKDIIITKDNKAVMIDFERCKQSKKPKNVTQFLQYIARNKEALEK